jgi:hypothetical protein
MRLLRRTAVLGSLFIVALTLEVVDAGTPAVADQHVAIDCEYSAICAEVANPAETFGPDYVGHDEPSNLFYSSIPGSGNNVQYSLTLPHDPSATNPNTPGKSYQFELNGAIWFGMALCATQSYPEQISTCTPDSDSNILDPTTSADHSGTAFVELQLYPPGWVPWPTWRVAMVRCDEHLQPG